MDKTQLSVNGLSTGCYMLSYACSSWEITRTERNSWVTVLTSDCTEDVEFDSLSMCLLDFTKNYKIVEMVFSKLGCLVKGARPIALLV